jgi:hypothetical protein
LILFKENDMRVSSSAPSMSRRSIMRGMAAALVGASVPVAAVGGLAARNLTGQKMTAEEFIWECDKIGYRFWAEPPRGKNGRWRISVIFPSGPSDVARGRWFELLRSFDERSEELIDYLARLERFGKVICCDGPDLGHDFVNHWDASTYTLYMIGRGEPCYSYHRGTKLVGVDGWLPELVGGDRHGSRLADYLKKLKRRHRDIQVKRGQQTADVMLQWRKATERAWA